MPRTTTGSGGPRPGCRVRGRRQPDQDDEVSIAGPAAVEAWPGPGTWPRRTPFRHRLDLLPPSRVTARQCLACWTADQGCHPVRPGEASTTGSSPATWAVPRCRATVRHAWRASGWFWRRTTPSCGRASRGSSTRSRTSSSWDGRRTSPNSSSSSRKPAPDVVVTDIRMPPDRDRRGDPGGVMAAGEPARGRASSSSASTRHPRMPSPSSRPARPDGPTCSRSRSRAPTSSPRRSGRWPQSGSMIDPQIVDELIEAKSSPSQV